MSVFPRYTAISVENRNFFLLDEGFPLNWVTMLGLEKRRMGCLADKEVWRYFSRLDTIHDWDSRTDGETPADSKYRAYA